MPYRFITSPNRYTTRARPLTRIGIHCTETDEDTAPGVAAYFKNPKSKASAHIIVDNDEVINCVKWTETAWAMPHVNADGWHIELCGHARWSRQEWMTTGLPILQWGACVAAQGAQLFGYFLGHFDVRWLRDDELRNGSGTGFVQHQTATRVLKPNAGHTDPGVNFPGNEFLGMVAWWLPQITRTDFR